MKKSFHVKNERLTDFYRLSGATFYDCINSIHRFINSFWDNKMSIFEEYAAFKGNWYTFKGSNWQKYLLPLSLGATQKERICSLREQILSLTVAPKF